MALYNFRRLITKYTVSCELVSVADGSWNAGTWQDGQTQTTAISGAIVPINERRIQNSGGSYKQGDCEFITLQPIELNSDTFLVYKDKKYKLSDMTDYSDYADFYRYLARRVSAFDTTGNNTADNT